MLPKILWAVLVIIAVFTITEAIPSYNPFHSLEDLNCTMDGARGTQECPSNDECECVQTKAFGIRSREFEGSIIKVKDLADGSPCKHRIRRDFMRLSKEERLRYIHAVTAVRTDPRTAKKFYDLIHIHGDNFCKVLHCRVFFLPWHRWFLLRYENLLREIEPNVTLVYWDWSMVMKNPFAVNLWDDNDWSFGGNGNGKNHTVITGAFKEPEWKMVPGNHYDSALQLRRYLNYTEPGIPSALHMAILFKLKPDEFEEWQTVFQAWHDNIHNKAFGWTSTMSNTLSAWTPEFFLHHTFVDKYWMEWQEQGYDYKFSEYYMKQTRHMQGTYYLPRDVIDLKYQEGNVCVSYEESSNDWIHKKLRHLTMDQLRDIRGLQVVPFGDANVMKWPNGKYSVFINSVQEFTKKRGLRNPITLDKLDGTDRQRGFRLHDLIEMSEKNSAN